MTVAASFDAAVIGAGPAGSACARWLAAAGCRVLLVERTRFEPPRAGETLAPEVQPLLVELGVWDRLGGIAAVPCWGTRSVWGDDAPREQTYITSPYGCGWHVDRARFDALLASAACEAGADLRTGAKLAAAEPDALGWRLVVARDGGAEPARACILIDATGRAAHVARRLGARCRRADALVGVAVWYGDVDVSREGFVLVEAEADGWWYSAPAGPGAMAAMLMTDADLAARAHAPTMDVWAARLTATPVTAGRLRQAMAAYGPRVFSAASHRLLRGDAAAPWLAVGDAAMAVDPISGSGVARALTMGREGARAALELVAGAGSAALERYESAREEEWHAYLAERGEYYAAEERWGASVFWQRRRGGHAARVNGARAF